MPSSPRWWRTEVAGADDASLVHAVHDVSGGGLAVALAEMAAAAGIGCAVDAVGDPSELFTELPSRFVVATSAPDDLCARAAASGVPTAVLGRAGGERVTVGPLLDLALGALVQAHEGNLALALGEP